MTVQNQGEQETTWEKQRYWERAAWVEQNRCSHQSWDHERAPLVTRSEWGCYREWPSYWVPAAHPCRGCALWTAGFFCLDRCLPTSIMIHRTAETEINFTLQHSLYICIVFLQKAWAKKATSKFHLIFMLYPYVFCVWCLETSLMDHTCNFRLTNNLWDSEVILLRVPQVLDLVVDWSFFFFCMQHKAVGQHQWLNTQMCRRCNALCWLWQEFKIWPGCRQ